MDIKIKTEKEGFKFRVCGILEHKNKYLAVKIMQNEFYCLPGGHAEIGEDTNEAVLREMREELGFEVEIKRLAGIAQNLFKTKKGELLHELGYYYIVKAKDESQVKEENYEIIENDKGELKKLRFSWLTKEELETSDFRPTFVKDMLASNGMLHVINKFDDERYIDSYIKEN